MHFVVKQYFILKYLVAAARQIRRSNLAYRQAGWSCLAFPDLRYGMFHLVTFLPVRQAGLAMKKVRNQKLFQTKAINN
jgi:hypothetical protein